jgi:RNA polymerase sigma-70 factor (sigma-E family)
MQRLATLGRQSGVGVSAIDATGEAAVGFEPWVAARGPAMLRFAYLVTGDAHDAQDAVQEALASACAKWDRVSRADDPDAYVRRMIANAHVSFWRRFAKRETPVAEVTVDQPVEDSTLPEDEAVWQLCGSLPRRQRAAVVLRFYEDLSYAEIAAVLQCSEATVRSQISRALASLRALIGEERNP